MAISQKLENLEAGEDDLVYMIFYCSSSLPHRAANNAFGRKRKSSAFTRAEVAK